VANELDAGVAGHVDAGEDEVECDVGEDVADLETPDAREGSASITGTGWAPRLS
jgi:hypothetical protein